LIVINLPASLWLNLIGAIDSREPLLSLENVNQDIGHKRSQGLPAIEQVALAAYELGVH